MIQELNEDFYIPTNEFQTEITKDFLMSMPEEVAEQLLDFVQNVEYIRNLISPSRRRAKDMPHDEQGRVMVDLANPHILENMDYFRPAALHFKQFGCYTFLRPNPNPNSEYRKWIDEEKRRCREGYVRESDGEWITGYMYWYMNYCPIMLTKITEGKKKADRVEDFPETWEGIYLRFHYLHNAREAGNHAIELARRGCSKSYTLASMMAKNLILGESTDVRKRVTTILTAYQKEYLADKDGTLSKFEPMINFVSENTEFPRLRLRSSSQEMFWQMGYLDSYGRKKGSLNSVMGVSSKDDSGKLRGKRGHIYFEEMGSFPNLLEIFDVVRQGMEEGDYTYGLAFLVGTAAEKESNFESAKTLLYNPNGYNIHSVKNVYDKPKQGNPTFGYFFPAYVNRKGCYNQDGVSDVVKALVQILQARYKAKYSSDPNSVLRVIAEMPITPAEAIIKVKNAFFPVTALTERLQQIDLDGKAYDDVYVGHLVLDGKDVKFNPSDETPIRKYGVDNTTQGALEIYEMPQKDSSGKVYPNRYIIGHDPVDNDQAESNSLSSTFVLDLYTDRIVAEYTGRQAFADDNFEIVRLLCLFYNAKCLYESNKKGIFAYFQKMQCTHLLADTPEYLRDKQMIKYSSFGSNAKGVNATAAINNYANGLIRDWLLKPVSVIVTEDGEEKETMVSNLYFIRGRALLEELIAFDPVRNFDRIRALGMLMIYREEKVILYGSKLNAEDAEKADKSYLGYDDYFERNYNQ
ncbi:MAG: hypothetical protein IJV29_18705 [Butyrivibrio sp.]|nr:hypothetical protein [Butyrivibrio sp.]MBQ7431643.1 hypothetical protein [Butyrivibrio sp.]